MGSAGEAVSQVVEEVKKDPVAAVANVATNVSTGGLVGVGQDKKFRMGAATRAADETLGEITGRNMQRQAIWDQEQRLKQAQLDAQAELMNSRQQAERDDIAASMAAGGARATAYARSRKNLAWKALGEEEKDFLGI